MSSLISGFGVNSTMRPNMMNLFCFLIGATRSEGDSERCSYAAFFFPAFNFAHLALCAAAIRFLPAAEIVRFGFGARLFAFAHRAFCARLMRLRADADTLRPGFA